MARKFGKKNIVRIDPFEYNLALFGLAGIGKSTLVADLCDEVLGEEGYIIYNMGKEDGTKALQGAIYEDVKSWQDFININNDIVKNKDTDYKELRMVVIDTIDELALLGEKEVIRLSNIENPAKRVKQFKATFGGFGAGAKVLSKLILDEIDRLKSVGINVFIVGHVKRRTKPDPYTNTEYDTITAKIDSSLFDDIKSKLDVLGVGLIRRDVEKTIVGEDIMGKAITKNVTKSESRVITFRDDNYSIDSKSRFAEIVPEIPLEPKAFYNAIKDAIEKSFNKKDVGMSMEKAKEIQEQQFDDKTSKAIAEAKEELTVPLMSDTIIEFYKTTDDVNKKLIGAKIKEFGIGKLSDLVTLDYEAVKTVYDLTRNHE